MSSISDITSACRGFVDQMNKSGRGWHDAVQQNYYKRRLYPLIETVADYQAKVDDYMRLLDNYNRQIAKLADMSPMGTGIGEHELFRQQIDPLVLEQIISRNNGY